MQTLDEALFAPTYRVHALKSTGTAEVEFRDYMRANRRFSELLVDPDMIMVYLAKYEPDKGKWTIEAFGRR